MVIDVIGDNHVGVGSLLFPVHDAKQNFRAKEAVSSQSSKRIHYLKYLPQARKGLHSPLEAAGVQADFCGPLLQFRM